MITYSMHAGLACTNSRLRVITPFRVQLPQRLFIRRTRRRTGWACRTGWAFNALAKYRGSIVRERSSYHFFTSRSAAVRVRSESRPNSTTRNGLCSTTADRSLLIKRSRYCLPKYLKVSPATYLFWTGSGCRSRKRSCWRRIQALRAMSFASISDRGRPRGASTSTRRSGNTDIDRSARSCRSTVYGTVVLPNRRAPAKDGSAFVTPASS